MNAMTWWDHATRSVWSQPWGASIAGPLKGTSLRLIPASIVPWGTWLAEHPDTTIVANDLDREFYSSERAYDEFVIGVALQDAATAYRYSIAAEQRVINDVVGSFPVAVFVDPDTRDIRVYLRRVGAGSKSAPTEVEFGIDEEGRIIDAEMGNVWDISRGVAVEGPLKGTVLQQIPYISSFDWEWEDFYPHSDFYGEEYP